MLTKVRRMLEPWPKAQLLVVRESAPTILRVQPSSKYSAYLEVVDEGYFHVFGPAKFEREIQDEQSLLDLFASVAGGRLIMWRSRFLPVIVRAETDSEYLLGGRALWRQEGAFEPW